MTSPHIIRRQFVEAEFDGSEADALVLQNRLLALCQYQLAPVLEALFDRLVPVQVHWIVDRLEIDAGRLPSGDLERLVEAVKDGLEWRLRQWARTLPSRPGSDWEDYMPGGTIRSRSDSQSLCEAFLYFLETGVLPWWFQLSAGQTLEDTILERWRHAEAGDGQPSAFARALTPVMKLEEVRKRLVRQFSGDFLHILIDALSRDVAAAVRQIFEELRQPGSATHAPPAFYEGLWESAFLSALAARPATASTLILAALEGVAPATRQEHSQFFGQIAATWPDALPGKARVKTNAHKAAEAASVQRPDKAKAAAKRAAGIDLEEGVYIRCAGMVLLHPFLPRFFEGLDIADKERLLQPDRAICLLHYLATGSSFAPEYELLLPKILCNVPREAAVNSRIQLTAAEEAEAAALLSAVIRHWDALGNTSEQNLRGSFLVRPGKLSLREGEYLLQVETRTYDVLLDRLPWGLGLVKLPWMRKALWVEWRP